MHVYRMMMFMYYDQVVVQVRIKIIWRVDCLPNGIHSSLWAYLLIVIQFGGLAEKLLRPEKCSK